MPSGPRLGGRFKLIELAGKGASGDVFRALDEESSRIVAVKCLADRLEDERAEERFTREVRLLATIDSPHVVRYVGHGRGADGQPFVAVDWLEGEDLAQRQRKKPLDGDGVVDLIEQTAAGLAAIHAIGVIHRDVKPSNIYLTDGGGGRLHVTVIDLGVAFTRSEPNLTQAGTMIGTPSYMAPEQILGNAALSSRTDVFSLGVVLFELIAGEKPYRGEDVMTVVAKIALQDAPHLAELVPTIPPEVDAVVARAMAKDPKARFASVTALAEALSRAPRFTPVPAARAEGDGPTRALASSASVDGMTISMVERRVVTAVFARFARSDASARAEPSFARIAREHGGVAHALLALGQVAIFGSAVSTGTEAIRAARAALALAREQLGAQITIATCRSVGGALGLSADAIERGARIAEGASGGSTVRVDEPTARLLGDTFEIRGEAPALELVGERPSESTSRTLLGRATPCFGRDREIAQLEALFVEVESEPVARVALVTGPAGVGKSRVRREVCRKLQARTSPPLVLLGRGTAVGDGAPFALAASLIRGLAGVRDDEAPFVQREKIARTIFTSDRLEIGLLIAQIAGVGDASRPGDDGVLVSDRLRAAFTQWLSGLLGRRAVALVLEDLQWADPPSIALIGDALMNHVERPLFVLAFARKEVETRFPRLWEAHAPETLRLAKLTRRASDALLRHVVGDSLEPDAAESILQRADGNAFYLEELIRAFTDALARGERADFRALPDTVLGMVQARLDALGTEAKRLVKAASIFGEVAWAGGIAEVVGSVDHAQAIDEELTALATNEVFERRVEGRFSGEHEYVFRHALVRDAAYELLPEEDRARAHLRVGAWLEAHGEHDALVLARHFDLGRAPERAAAHYRKAAEQALFGSDFSAAVACANKALAAAVDGEAEGELELLVAEALRWSGDMRGALEAASSASRKLARGSKPWFSAMREIVATQGRLGNAAVIEPLAERILETPASEGESGAKIAALVPAAVHLLYGGNLPAAKALAGHIEALAVRAQSLEPRVKARLHQLRSGLAIHQDDAETGILEQTHALAEYERAGDHRAAALVRANLGFALIQVGQLERAHSVLEEALQIATGLGLVSVRGLVLQNLGTALAHGGRLDEAFDAHSRAIGIFEALKDPRLGGWSRVGLAFILHARGDLERAEAEARAVVQGGVEPLAVGAHAVLARTHLSRGNTTEALAEAERAQAVLERLETVEEFEISARLVLAEALAARGEASRALSAILVAKARVEARRDKVRDPALRRSMIDRIPEHTRVLELAATWSPSGS